MAEDPYLIPGTTVLKNRLGVNSQSELNRLEADFTTTRIWELARQPVSGRFDLAHLKKIHAHIFQDVYAWAGEPRTISISKGASMFCLPQHLEFAAEDIFGKLARENHLKGLSREVFADRAAYFFSEINALHPFREGNGRTQNLFLKQLGAEAGFELSIEKVGCEQMMALASAAHRGELDLARAMFLERAVALPERIGTAARQVGRSGSSVATQWLSALQDLRQAHQNAGSASERTRLVEEAKTLAVRMTETMSPTQRTRLKLLAVEAVQGSVVATPEKVVAQTTQAKSKERGRGR